MLSSDEVVTLPVIRLAVSARSGWKTRWLFIVMFH
jgi:hypothetical protein